MDKIWVDIESPLGTPLGSGPIMTARNLRYVDRESRVGEFVFEMSIADPQSALVSGDRYAKFYTIMNNARTLLGTGIIETITVSISPQGEPTKTVSGPNLMGELGWRTMKDLAIYTTETRTPDSVQYYDGTAVSYLDMTDTYDGNDATGVAVPADDEDWIYVGDADPFDIVDWHLGTNRNSDPGNFKVEYSKGSGSWGSGTILSDTTKANEVDDPASPGNWGASWWTVDGQIRWERKSDWATDTVNSVSGKYWLRFRYSEDMSAAANGGEIDVNEIEIIEELPVDTGPADILAYATAYGPNDDKDWAFASNGYYSATASDVMMKFSGQSVMEALIKMAEITGEHFRLGTGREIEWLQTDQTASGVRAVLPSDAIAGLGDTGLYYIRSFRQSSDAYEIITRVNPHGAGQGSARVSLVNCSDSASAGFTLTKASNLLVYDTAESTWNKRERAPFWKMIGSPTVGNMLDSQASNALLKMAERYLLVHSAPQVAYDLQVAKIDSLVRPGDTIRVEFLRVIDGVKVVDVDAGVGLDLYILETVLETGQVGPLTMTLKVATIDAWPDTDDSATDSALSEFEVFQAMDSPLSAASLTASSLAAIVASLDLSLYYRKPTNTNVILGLDAGNVPPASNHGVFVGYEAGYSSTSGQDNTFLGYRTGYTTTTGYDNTMVGSDAMRLGSGTGNTGVGYRVLENVGATTDGLVNTAVGTHAMRAMDEGDYNVAVGGHAMVAAEASNCVAIGYQALTDVTGGNDIAVGCQAGRGLTSGVDSILIGSQAGYTITTGDANIAIGYQAMQLTGTGVNYNVAIGSYALQDIGTTSDGDMNTAVGWAAMMQGDQGEYNVAIGASALANATNGDGNTAVGTETMHGSGTPVHNVAIGYQAMYGGGTSPTGNVAVGVKAGIALNTGNYNVAVGMEAMYWNAASHNNIVIGYRAGYKGSTTTYDNCVIVGHEAGYLLESGNANVFIGYQAGYNETGANKLYIENSNSATPLIYGEFDNDLVKIHGDLCLGTEDGLGRLNFTEGTAIADGIVWGSDANKVTLYRSADDVLKTDDSLTVALGLNVGTATGAIANGIRLGDIAVFYVNGAGAASTASLTRNAYWDGAWKRRVADNDVAMMHMNIGGDILFYAQTDANDTADSAITLGERLRVLNTGGVAVSGKLTVDVDTGGTYDSTTVAAIFGDIDAADSLYIIGNTLNAGYSSEVETTAIVLNYRGHEGGVTKFRDVQIADGKGTMVAWFDGSAGAVYNQADGEHWNTTSDELLKRDIISIRDALVSLRLLEPITFRFNEQYREVNPDGDLQRLRSGFTAQNFAKVFPQQVFRADKYQTMNTSGLDGLVVAGLQELDNYRLTADAEREAIRAEMAGLRQQQDQLGERLDQLERGG